MSDNTIQLKVSLDTSELDKLEEQLTRIKQLMADIGINISIKPEKSNDFFIAGSGGYFIKDAVIDGAKLKCCTSGNGVFSGVLVSNKSEQNINAQLADLRMRADRQDAGIAELIKVRQEVNQAWAQAVNHVFNKA